MMKRRLEIKPEVKCSCGLSKVRFYLIVKSFVDKENTVPRGEEPLIVPGTQLMTRDGKITDYIRIEGVCSDKSCCRKHEAKLEVRGGIVQGIQKGTIRALTEKKETLKKWGVK